MRGILGMTGGDVADRLGVAQGTVSRWETGNHVPSPLRVEEWRTICASSVRSRIQRGGLSVSAQAALVAIQTRLECEGYKMMLRRLTGGDSGTWAWFCEQVCECLKWGAFAPTSMSLRDEAIQEELVAEMLAQPSASPR